MPRLRDLPPADTSSYVALSLAGSIRRRHPATDEFVFDDAPAESGALREAVAGHDLLVLGTVSAHLDPAQGGLAGALLALAGRQ